MKIVRSKESDLRAIAKCHKKAFPKGFATAMGRRVVEKMMSWYLSTDKAFLFHIEEEGEVKGYVGGIVMDGTLTQGSASAIANHATREAMRAFIFRPWLLFHKQVRMKYIVIIRNLLYKLGLKEKYVMTDQQMKDQRKDPYAGLVVIGVHPQSHGKGYGSLLLKEFERIVIEEYGIKRMQLSVDIINEPAVRAYERNGWVRGVEFRGGMVMTKTVE